MTPPSYVSQYACDTTALATGSRPVDFRAGRFCGHEGLCEREFQAGQAFPSVRALAAELKIHPNTAHKAVQYLIQEGWLEPRPGIGTVVAERPSVRPSDRRRLLHQEVEQLVVEAKRVGVDLPDLLETIESQWQKLDQAKEG